MNDNDNNPINWNWLFNVADQLRSLREKGEWGEFALQVIEVKDRHGFSVLRVRDERGVTRIALTKSGQGVVL